jgi:hypothetical protein
MLRSTLINIGKKIKKALLKSKIQNRERSRGIVIINQKRGKIKRGQ